MCDWWLLNVQKVSLSFSILTNVTQAGPIRLNFFHISYQNYQIFDPCPKKIHCPIWKSNLEPILMLNFSKLMSQSNRIEYSLLYLKSIEMRSQPIIDDMKIKEFIFVLRNEMLCNIKRNQFGGYNSNSLDSISISIRLPPLIHFKSFFSSYFSIQIHFWTFQFLRKFVHSKWGKSF